MSLRNGRSKQARFQGENRWPGIAARAPVIVILAPDSSLPRPRCQGCTVRLEATADLDENCGHRQRFWDAASAPASRARKPAESGDYNSKATGQLGLESQRRGSEMRSVQRARNKSVRARLSNKSRRV